jgi:FkbM family methyltransferase
VTLKYSPRTDIGRSLYLHGSFEEGEIAIVVKALSAEASRELVIFDVGANIGVHSIVLCQSLRNTRLTAFEPSAATRELLQYNININNLSDRVKVESCAVSNAQGTADFYNAIDDAYSSLKDTKRKQILGKAVVPLTTLDHYVRANNIKKLDMIKVDVEGYENEVIEGGLKVLTTMKPDLFVEIYKGSNSNPDPGKTVRTLLDLGYKAWVMVDGKLEPYKEHSDDRYNYYFSIRDVDLDLK